MLSTHLDYTKTLRTALALAAALPVLSGCACAQNGGRGTTLTNGPISGSQTSYDTIELRPARTDWQPGLVFTGTVDGTRILVDDILCPTLFPGVKPSTTEIALNSIKGGSDLTFNISLTPLEKLVGKNQLNVDLPKLQREAAYKLDPGQAFDVYYAKSQLWKEGEPVEVDINCQREIDLAKQDGQFENHVWIVPGARAYSGASYTFSKSFNLTAGLKADFEKLLTAAAGAGYKTNTEGGMTKISEGKLLYVRTAVPRLVRTWVRSTAAGAGAEASITTEMPSNNITAVSDR